MTLKRSTRSAILLSILSLVLCFTMLLGTTFAWFTDTATTGVNKIQAGTLKIDLHHLVDGDWVSIKDNKGHKVFDYDKWEPGYTQYESLKITNDGTLSLKFKLTSFIDDKDPEKTYKDEATGTVYNLADVIDVYVANGVVEKPENFKAITDSIANDENVWRNAGPLSEIMADADGMAYGIILPAGTNPVDADNLTDSEKAVTSVGEVSVTLALHMREEAGNEYQDLYLGGMYLQLLATQQSYEDDSFDHTYDKGLTPIDEGETLVEENNVQYLYSDDGEVYLYLVTEDYAEDTFVVPEGVTALGNYSLSYNDNVKTVVLSDTVRSLGRAFDTSSVEKVVLNEGLEQIDSRAFRSATNLEEVVISSTVKVIADNAFQKAGIKRIVIPATVETIGETAFGASLIEEVIFEGNTSVQGYAFRGCTKLRTVKFYGDDNQFIPSTLNDRNSMWFCNGESNNPGTSNITFYVTNDTMKERVLTAMGYEKDNTTVIMMDVVKANDSTSLQAAIDAAPTTGETVINLASGTYSEDLDLTAAALGTAKGDLVFKAEKGAEVVFAGTVTLGYRNQGVGAANMNADVTFEGVTFDNANAAAHSLDVQDVNSVTLRNCTIIGDGEYGITSARGNGTGKSTIVGCKFINAGVQVLGNFGTGLVIDDCEFINSRVNVQAGNGVTVKNCEFTDTLTNANNNESFYLIRSNATPITVTNCDFFVDSTIEGVGVPGSKGWGILVNRGTTNWTVDDIRVNLTPAAEAQTALNVATCTSSGKINITKLTLNGVEQ